MVLTSVAWNRSSSQPFFTVWVFFLAETICTALKLMTENASLLENNLSFDYHFNAGSLGNICLCLSVTPPADTGNCWEGLLCRCVNWKKAKPLVNDLVVAVTEEKEWGLALDEAPTVLSGPTIASQGPLLKHPLPSSLPLVPVAVFSRDSQNKILTYTI